MPFEDERDRWAIFDLLTRINARDGPANPVDIAPGSPDEETNAQLEEAFGLLEGQGLIEPVEDGHELTLSGLQFIADEAGKIRAVQSLGGLLEQINELTESQRGGEGGATGEPGSGGHGGQILTVGDTDMDGATISAEGGRGGDYVTQPQGCLQALWACLKRLLPFLGS